jgi:hypothetical protein
MSGRRGDTHRTPLNSRAQCAPPAWVNVVSCICRIEEKLEMFQRQPVRANESNWTAGSAALLLRVSSCKTGAPSRSSAAASSDDVCGRILHENFQK